MRRLAEPSLPRKGNLKEIQTIFLKNFKSSFSPIILAGLSWSSFLVPSICSDHRAHAQQLDGWMDGWGWSREHIIPQQPWEVGRRGITSLLLELCSTGDPESLRSQWTCSRFWILSVQGQGWKSKPASSFCYKKQCSVGHKKAVSQVRRTWSWTLALAPS